MKSTERLTKAFNLELPDRPPILGGWLATPEHIQTLTGCSEDEYWAAPFQWGLKAEHILGSDGIVGIFKPEVRGDYRVMSRERTKMYAQYTVESVLAEIAKMPEPEELEANFDEDAEYDKFVAEYKAKQSQCGDILWCPLDWHLIPLAFWHYRFGYENVFLTIALHPDRYLKLLRIGAVTGRQKSMIRARAIREGIHPRAVLTGHDLCSAKGPMVSPAYLRREYFPRVEYALEPLVDVGAKIVWHCDGDYRLILDDLLACGIGGLQGFQQECGMDLKWIANLHANNGDPLLIFGAMSVTTTLPFGALEEVQAEVRRTMSLCRDKASLVFFTSNTITPDIPLGNVQAFWQTVLESSW